MSNVVELNPFAGIEDRDPYSHGQDRWANRLAGKRKKFRYVAGIGWHVWADSHWAQDEGSLLVREAVRGIVREARRECGDRPDKDENKKLLQADIAAGSTWTGVRGVLELAAGALRAPIDALDADPEVFNCSNGTLDLRTGELRPHNAHDLLTKVAGAEYDPAATAPTWDKYLADTLPNEAVRAFVQRLIGYAMLGKVTEAILPVLVGPAGGGKSTFSETMQAVFGHYAQVISTDALVESSYARHPTEIARLRGARLVFGSETEEGQRLATARVKYLTGGDTRIARFMRMDEFQYTPSDTICLITNHRRNSRPTTVASGGGSPSSNSPGRSRTRIAGWGTSSRAEAAGILRWAVDGHAAYRAGGLQTPEAVLRANDELKTDNDVIGSFLAECCHVTESAHAAAHVTAKASDLYAAWTAWCAGNGETPGTGTAFGSALRLRGFERKRVSGGYQYLGIGVSKSNGRQPGDDK